MHFQAFQSSKKPGIASEVHFDYQLSKDDAYHFLGCCLDVGFGYVIQGLQPAAPLALREKMRFVGSSLEKEKKHHD